MSYIATRHRRFRSFREDETYVLIFTHQQGEPHIHIAFKDSHEHDTINVMNYEDDTTRVNSVADFKREVNEYTNALTRDALRVHWLNSGAM